jgi:hypothetical protein
MTGVATVAAAACNGVLGNEPGYLVDPTDGSPAEAAAPSDAGQDGLDSSLEGGPPNTQADAQPDGGWTPAGLGAALALWLDGDRGVTTTACASNSCVAIWADQSGNGNTAYVDLERASPPVVAPATYNGHRALRFDGSSTSFTVADAPSLQPSGSCTIVAVAAEQRAFHQGALYSKTALDYPYVGIALWGSYTGGFPHGAAVVQVDFNQYAASPNGGIDDAKLHLFAGIFDGARLSLVVDDAPPVSISATVPPPFGAPGVAAFVGGNPAGGQVFIGDIAEVILVGRTLDATEWAAMRAYLNAKYGTL